MVVNRYCLLLLLTITSLWISLPKSLVAQGLKSQKAFDLVLPDKNGQNIQLKDLKGKYVLLHFWASWCPNSAVALPNMKSIYTKYKEANFETADGFEIFSVSLDKDKSKWKAAMKTHRINWQSCIDSRGFDSPLALSYGVWYTPVTFLIDPTGVIIAENPSFSYIDNLLEEEKIQEKISYKIQIGKFPILKFHNFARVKELGNMEIEKDKDGQNLVLIGAFDKKKTAEYIVEQVVEQGYKQAHIVAYNREERLASLPTEEPVISASISESYVKFTERTRADEIVFTPVTKASPKPAPIVDKLPIKSLPKTDGGILSATNKIADQAKPVQNLGFASAKPSATTENSAHETSNYPFNPPPTISRTSNKVADANDISPVASNPTIAIAKEQKKESKTFTNQNQTLSFDLTATTPSSAKMLDEETDKKIVTSKAEVNKKEAKAAAIYPTQPFSSYPPSYKNASTGGGIAPMSDYMQALANSGKPQVADLSISNKQKRNSTKKRSSARIIKDEPKTIAKKETKEEFIPWPKSNNNAPIWDETYSQKRKSYEKNDWKTEETTPFEEIAPQGKKARKMKRRQEKLKRKRAKYKQKVKTLQEQEMSLKEAITIRSIYGD